MYTLIRAIPLKQLLMEQVPIILASLTIAELFYKFHSFTLEAIAFLATWYVLDAIVWIVTQAVAGQRQQKNSP
ncbi:MAG: hypothetical protein ACU84H_11330 [Gammaproteobacteria bacterium]